MSIGDQAVDISLDRFTIVILWLFAITLLFLLIWMKKMKYRVLPEYLDSYKNNLVATTVLFITTLSVASLLTIHKW